jgi:hypothetical protein
MIETKVKGRGAQFNPKNRFERLYIEAFQSDEIDNFFLDKSGKSGPSTLKIIPNL